MLLISAVYDTPERGYKKMAENMRKSAELLGYSVILRDLKEDPMDSMKNAYDYHVNCYFKPHVILDALNSLPNNIAWIDGDCLIRDRFDEILNDCDMALTLRRFKPNTIRDQYDGYINAGVMAFRNCEATKRVIREWIKEQPNGRADQDAINRVLLRYTCMNDYNEIVDIEGCRVKLVSCDKYNFFYFPETPDDAKILHIKGSLRPEFYDAYARETCLES